jgi:hypothetical protein
VKIVKTDLVVNPPAGAGDREVKRAKKVLPGKEEDPGSVAQ